MPKGISLTTAQCNKCGRDYTVSRCSHSPHPRCPDCPRMCCRCGKDFIRHPTRTRHGDYRCRDCQARERNQRNRDPHGRFTVARHVAKRRKMAWELSEDEYTRLRSLPCHYCGFPLPETGVGLDRTDPKLGYVPGNVVPCCAACNVTKGDFFTMEEMLVIGAAIAQVKRARLAAGLDPVKSMARGMGRRRQYAIDG